MKNKGEIILSDSPYFSQQKWMYSRKQIGFENIDVKLRFMERILQPLIQNGRKLLKDGRIKIHGKISIFLNTSTLKKMI